MAGFCNHSEFDSNSDAGNLTVDSATFTAPLVLLTAGDISDGGASGTDITADSAELSGNVAPGASPGILSIAGDLTLADGGMVSAEINGTTAGTEYDQLDVVGAVTISSNVELTITLGAPPVVGNAYTILNNDGADAIIGTFAGLDEGDSLQIGDVVFIISYTGGDGNDIVLTTFSVTTVTLSQSNVTATPLILLVFAGLLVLATLSLAVLPRH